MTLILSHTCFKWWESSIINSINVRWKVKVMMNCTKSACATWWKGSESKSFDPLFSIYPTCCRTLLTLKMFYLETNDRALVTCFQYNFNFKARTGTARTRACRTTLWLSRPLTSACTTGEFFSSFWKIKILTYVCTTALVSIFLGLGMLVRNNKERIPGRILVILAITR